MTLTMFDCKNYVKEVDDCEKFATFDNYEFINLVYFGEKII